jgi:glutathione S-transferase
MSLTLYFHPLSSYCQKALIALYETGVAFEPRFIDLGDPTSRATLTAIWPIGKFPVLRDEAHNRTVPESTIIIEYLAQHYPGARTLVPADTDLARETRLRDRFFDLHVGDQMIKIITDRLRPAGQNDRYGVEDAKRRLAIALDMLDQDMGAQTWAIGDQFTMADCAAAPALFYSDMIIPLRDGHKNVAAYLDRLKARPSYARALKEAEPYLELVPKG